MLKMNQTWIDLIIFNNFEYNIFGAKIQMILFQELEMFAKIQMFQFWKGIEILIEFLKYGRN